MRGKEDDGELCRPSLSASHFVSAGGENEKIMILSQLQSPPKHSDPGKAAEALRAWLSWLQRADDVSVAKPGPSILARGLTAMTAEILHKIRRRCSGRHW